MNKKTLGPVVKEARDALRLTQRELAAIVNVKASHIAYIENNHRRPSMSLLRRLVEALGLDRREVLFLVHPDAKYLTDDSTMPGNAKAGDSWKQFAANHAMLRRHNVSPAELRVLKQVSLLESISHPRHFLFVLNSIRQAGSGSGL
jgi:transcriptional regulator with XRE-family HTH domain